MIVALYLLSTFFALSTASSCWRNTTCTGPVEAQFQGPWDNNIYAPDSRIVRPETILSSDGDFISEFTGNSSLQGDLSALVFDFGVEVGGIVTVDYVSSGPGSLGLAFTESKKWIGEASDSSNGGFEGPDGALYADILSGGDDSYVIPDNKLRGGFRYLTLFLETDEATTLSITDISLEIAFQPTWENLRAYQGYFHSSDEQLNKIWYAGAYTLQTNSVPVDTGRQTPFPESGWNNNDTLGPGDTIIVDGAKRDRAVWPGDMGIAVPSTFVSVGDLDSVKNALQVMYNYQNPDGSFPEAGPPLLQQESDTYHMWTMIGTYNYLLYTNDTDFLASNWEKYLKAMDFIYGKVDESGLLNVTGLRDWARWQTGFNESQANMILYHTLQTGASLADWLPAGSANLSSEYLSRAESLQSAILTHCFDEGYGLFKDNATDTTLYPQDANSMALQFGVVPKNGSHAESISAGLTGNWTPIGAETPELPGNISPFISSFEIQAHLEANRADRALELIRRSWGWYLENENGTQSTVIEGYLTNGTFGYRSDRGYDFDESYVSHAHGWSSGPTSALTEYIAGLRVTKPLGQEWSLKPHFGDLEWAQAGFTTGLGRFEAKWKFEGGRVIVEWDTPEGTRGWVDIPGGEGMWVEGGEGEADYEIEGV